MLETVSRHVDQHYKLILIGFYFSAFLKKNLLHNPF